jgi:hypothetical protein
MVSLLVNVLDGKVRSDCFTDEFIPSQLFMVNHDLLAQYWLPFDHISYYQRIDLDKLIDDTFRCGS